METDWKYIGDVNLEYGGYYYRYDLNSNNFPYYAEIVRIIDLDSACGANGLTLIEKLTTFDFENKERVKECLSVIGLNPQDLRGKGKETIIDIILDSFLAYGYYDPNEDYVNPSNWVIVNDNYGACDDKSHWDGWKPDKEETVKLHKQYNGDLKAYIESEVLD